MKIFEKTPPPAFTGIADALNNDVRIDVTELERPDKKVRVKRKGSWMPKGLLSAKKKENCPNCLEDRNLRLSGSAVKVLSINCEGCEHAADLKSPECRLRCVGLVGKHLCDKLVLDDGFYKKEYQEGDVRKLKELYDLGEEVKLAFPAECGECAVEHEKQVEALKEHIKKDPVGLLTRGIEVSENQEMTVSGIKKEICLGCRKRAEDLVGRTLLGLKRCEVMGGYDFAPLVRPFFSNSRVLIGTQSGEEILSEYEVSGAGVTISRDNEDLYSILPLEYGFSKKQLEVMKSAYSQIIKTPCVDEKEFAALCRREMLSAAAKHGCEFGLAANENMAGCLVRCTAGLDVLELLLKDAKLQDVYINSPIDSTPIYVKHEDYDDCRTNIYLSEEAARNIISKFRLKSGRAFSEVSPVLDMELPEFGVRVNITGPPISPDGLAFAFRRANDEPWTLLRFIENKMISPLAAGLLGTMVNEESTVLVGGDRGSGKTSLLVALLGAMSTKYRILTMEDTFEIPVPSLERAAGFRIQRMRIRPSTSTDTFEMGASEAMRSLLRMGDSAIVMGEVRGEEAKTLYEAMNVGGSGNCVLGTIHGKSPRNLFERIVYSLGVPAQSFKATDLVVMADRIRPGGGSKKLRRVTRIVEVKKRWGETEAEDVFSTLMVYDREADALIGTEIMKNPKNSEVIRKIADRRGVGTEHVLEEINARADAYSHVVDMYRQSGDGRLLSVRTLAELHQKFNELVDESIADNSKTDFSYVLDEIKKWCEGYPKVNKNVEKETIKWGMKNGDVVSSAL